MMIDPLALGLEIFEIRGDEVQVLCPFHDDHRPSASFNIVKGVIYCYACGASYRAKQLAIELGGDVIELEDKRILKRIKEEKEWRQFLLAPLAYDHPYLEERKVTNEQVEKFDIRDVKSHLAFVLRDHKKTIRGIQLRQIPPRLLRRADQSMHGNARGSTSRYVLFGAKPPLWPCDQLQSIKRPLIVEGVFGVLRADQFGVRAFATLSATPTYRTLVTLNGRRPLIAFDNDYAGCVGAAKILINCGGEVSISGIAADEIDNQRDMEHLTRSSNLCCDVRSLATRSGNENRFWSHLSRWMKKYVQ